MADLEYGEFGSDDTGAYEAPGRIGGVVNLMGAAMSAVLVVGLAIWGYKLLVRDATGVPVVRALEGPMRVQPDDPGGNRAAHQGLAVNRIAAVGEAAPPPEEIVLAPRSTDLAPEDMPQGLLRTQPALAPAPVAAPGEPADPLEAAILSATTDVMTAEADLSGEALFEVIPASVPGLSRSLRPRLRPEGLAARAPAEPETAPAASEVAELDPASLAAGTRLVQFGAYADAEEARAAWASLEGRFGSLLEGKGRVIEEATTGGRTFFRLRAAGFSDLADARRFCAVLVAEQADCIPVVVR